jgi:hypothetical protein
VVARLDAAQEAIEQGNAQLVNEQGPVLVGGVCVHVYAIALCVIALYAVAFCVPLCVVVSFAIALNKSLCWWVPLHRPLHHQHTHAHTHTHTHTTLPCLHTPHLCQPPLFFQLPQVDVIARDALDSSAPQLQQAVALHALSALVAVSAASATAAPYSAGATTTSAPGVRGGAFGGELAASAVILHSRTGCTSK